MFESLISIFILAAHVVAILALILSEKREPTATLSWLLFLIFLPGLGLALYFLIGRRRARKVAHSYAEAYERVETVVSREHMSRFEGSLVDSPSAAAIRALTRLGSRLSSTPPTGGNKTQMLVDAAVAFPAIEAAIASAQDHVHLEFFIVRGDGTGIRLREQLQKAAARGVEVRFLCDAVGSFDLSDDFFQLLREVGGQGAFFRPVSKNIAKFYLRDRVDFRNHRKIVVVDGRIGFTGGINVGREYLGLDPERGHWRDTHMRIEGPATLAMQKAFAEDWFSATGELLDKNRYFPVEEMETKGKEVVQIVDSGPDRSHSPISFLFVQAFSSAAERLWLTSPYFIPSPGIEQGLLTAALRGVDVRLLVPKNPDHKITAWAGASYFGSLLDAGVRIYRYDVGFIHAKVLLVDDWLASIGSANMDIRSFDLNYELNAFIYGPEFNDSVATQFLIDLEHAEEWTQTDEDAVGPLHRILRALARLLSPIL